MLRAVLLNDVGRRWLAPSPHAGYERRRVQTSRCRALLVVVGKGDCSLCGLAHCLVLTGAVGLPGEDHYWIER